MKIFMGTIDVENFMPNIFGNVTFFSRVHLSRENQENELGVHVLTLSTKGDKVGDHGLNSNSADFAETLKTPEPCSSGREGIVFRNFLQVHGHNFARRSYILISSFPVSTTDHFLSTLADHKIN